MWEMNELQRNIWERKYQHNGETFDEWLDRVSNGDENIRELIEKQRFLFGGRILSNRGLQKEGKKVTYSNCYVISTDDSIEDIYQTCSDLARTFSYGGGVGVDISKLRPIGSEVNNTAKTTSGACSFMPTFSQVAETIGQNGRRAALMLSMDVNHPEIKEFINMKTNTDQVTKANISVRVDDEFMNKVVHNKTHVCSYELPNGEVVNKVYKARDLFKLLCENNYDWGEPGILYWDTIEDYNLLSEDDEFEYAGVNPCAEEPLPNGGSCLLGSFNLSAYVIDGEFDIELFKKDIPVVIKAMNDVLDEGLPLHPLEIQRKTVRDYRQIGIGIMGIGDMLIKLGLKYGDKESLELCDKIGYTLADSSLKASSWLAKEEGAFPKCKVDKILKSSFIRNNASEETKKLIKQYGLRNSQLLTIAPTGTLSTMLGITGGIEPIFATHYTRKTESLHDKDVYYKVYTPIVEEYMKSHKLEDDKDLPDYFVTAQTLGFDERIDMQSVWQKHIDASISSTINLPHDAKVEDVQYIYIKAWKKGLKGVTIFRDGCKRMGVLTMDDKKEEPIKENELKRGEWSPIPDDTIYVKRKVYTGCGKLNLFIGYSPSENRLVEIYTKRSGNGGCEHNIDSTVISMSGMLRLGGTLDNVKKAYEGCGACNSFTRARCSGKKLSPGKSCATAILNMIEKTIQEINNNQTKNEVEKKEVDTSDDLKVLNDKVQKANETKQELLDKGLCPECKEPLDNVGGCVTCNKCGFSRCE